MHDNNRVSAIKLEISLAWEKAYNQQATQHKPRKQNSAAA
jgi:hypothetical protein